MYRGALLATAALLLAAAGPPATTGHIEGTVRDSAGAPIANVQVYVLRRPWTAMSDSLGRYRLADVPAGRYTVRATAIGYRSLEVQDVSVTPGRTTPLDLTLAASAGGPKRPIARRYDQQPRDQGGVAAGIAGAAEGDQELKSRMAPVNQSGSGRTLMPPPMNTENYALIEESRFLPAAANPRSTFSMPPATPTSAASSPPASGPPPMPSASRSCSTTSATTTPSPGATSPSASPPT